MTLLIETPYFVAADEDRKKAIKDAMAEIERKTCVKFVPRKGQRAYLAIEPKNG